jgi:hypothetical protein
MLTGDRLYIGLNPDDKYLSVTTILSALPRQIYLVPWAAKLAAERAWETIHTLEWTQDEHEFQIDEDGFIKYVKDAWRETRDNAGSVGDEVHTACDAILAFSRGNAESALAFSESLALTGEAEPFVQHFLTFLGDNDVRVVANEYTVYNDTHGYAGSCDLAAYINGEPWVIDIKTSKSLHEEMALQVCAYTRGEYVVNEDGSREDLPFDCDKNDIVRGGVLHLQKTKCKLREVDIDDTMFDAFLSLLLVKRLWLSSERKTALGEVVYDSKVYAKEHKDA